MKSATSSPTPWKKSAKTASSPSKRRKASTPRSKSSKACSSTAGSFHPISSPTPTRMECLLEEPLILIHDKKISAMKDLLPLLEKTAQMGKQPPDHRRRGRRRGARDAGRQQTARHSQSRPLSRPRASATAEKPCSKTSRCSPAAS